MEKTKHSVDNIKVESAKIAMKNLLSKIPSSCSFNFTAHNALICANLSGYDRKNPTESRLGSHPSQSAPLSDAGDLSNLWSVATLFCGFESIADLL